MNSNAELFACFGTTVFAVKQNYEMPRSKMIELRKNVFLRNDNKQCD